jgi:hypothetical protein
MSQFSQLIAAEVLANAGAVTPTKAARRTAIESSLPKGVRLRPRSTLTPRDEWNELDLKAAGMLTTDELAGYQGLKRQLWGMGYPWREAKDQLLYAIWTSYKQERERNG